MLACLLCSQNVTQKGSAGPTPTYCSVACKRAAAHQRQKASEGYQQRLDEKRAAAAARRSEVVKECPQCSVFFSPPLTTKQLYCSKPCARAAADARITRTCAQDGCERPLRAKGLCGSHYNQTRPRSPSAGDPEVIRKNRRIHTQRRRAAKLAAPNERIDRDVVGDRDGWKCGICSRKVKPNLPWPSPMSPSLDHIEPLSLGGAHLYVNVRIAHLRCNVRRQNRIEAEQLMLIG